VKSFQTALKQQSKLGRLIINKNTFASRNDLAFVVSDVHFASEETVRRTPKNLWSPRNSGFPIAEYIMNA
jgi:hypothetical protein